MHEVYLSRPEHGGSKHLHNLMDDIVRANSAKGKVYTTTCHADDKTFVFMTTSKETHLRLGLFSQHGLINLCLLLQEEFAKLGRNELMLVSEVNSYCLVTKVTEVSMLTKYQLTPAN